MLQSLGVYVENLSEFVVRSPSEVLNLLAVGKKRLVFAETKMNRNSSRFELHPALAEIKFTFQTEGLLCSKSGLIDRSGSPGSQLSQLTVNKAKGIFLYIQYERT